MTFYGLGKLAGKYDLDNLTPYEVDKCKKNHFSIRRR